MEKAYIKLNDLLTTMRTLYGLVAVVAVVIVLFLIYSPLTFLYIVGGAICAAVVVVLSVPKTETDREAKEPLFPSSRRGTDISAAWLGAKMDEEEEMRGKAEKKPR